MKTLVPLSVLMLAVSAARADDKPPPNVPIHVLIANEAVQEALKVTEDQKKGIEEISKEAREASQGLRNLERAERQKKQTEIRQKVEEKVGKLLKDAQTKRLHEIDLQQRGPLAVQAKKIADALELTDEQRKSIREMSTKMNQDIAKLREDGARGEELATKSGKLRLETAGKVAKMLTDEQKKKWEKMIGEKFDISKITNQRR